MRRRPLLAISLALPLLAGPALALAPFCAAAGEPPPSAVRPWEPHIAALTDPRAQVHQPAIEALVRHGEAALPDLELLLGDADWRVRGRLAAVAAGIGGPRALAIALSLAADREPPVRELAALGLGRLAGVAARERLRQLLETDPEAAVRIAAATGLATSGDPEGLGWLSLAQREGDRAVRAAMRDQLVRAAADPRAVPRLAELIASTTGPQRLALIEASRAVGDPRLAPALAGVVVGADPTAAAAAAASLGANGDSRALGPLCAAAAGGVPAVAAAAAATLRGLTGHGAGPGPAWTLWWRDHAAEVEALAGRDELIAACHDPAAPVDAAALGAFSPEQLWPLVEGVLGEGARWWPPRALQVLRADRPGRWTPPLVAALRAAGDPQRRLALIVLLDQLGDPAAAAPLAELLGELRQRLAKAPPAGRAANQPERLALEIALERRGQAPAATVERVLGRP